MKNVNNWAKAKKLKDDLRIVDDWINSLEKDGKPRTISVYYEEPNKHATKTIKHTKVVNEIHEKIIDVFEKDRQSILDEIKEL